MRIQDARQSNKVWKACLIVSTGSVAALAVLTFLDAGAAQAGAQSPTFEVASVKPNKSLDGTRGAGFQPGGRFLARNMPLRSLIAIAFGDPRPLQTFRIVGGPDWMDSDRFDVEAKQEGNFPETQVEAGFSTSGELMLQALLAERFKLRAHKELQQLQVFALTSARNDGRLGPQLRTSSGADCSSAPIGGRPVAPDSNALPRCELFQFVGATVGNLRHARARFMTMEQLARNLETSVGRVVVNRTALAGNFSFDFEFTPGFPASRSSDSAVTSDSGTSLFTALQEQLGLKLEPARGPVDVIVVDHAEHPSPD